MTHPQKVSRKEFEAFAGARWNAMIDLCSFSNILDLNPVQRAAHLAFWYMSEVYNGGHYQYLVNQHKLNHREVVNALRMIGANDQASVLESLLDEIGAKEINLPQTVEEFLLGNADANLSEFDTRFNNCQRNIEACLEIYLDKHEFNFIEWVP